LSVLRSPPRSGVFIAIVVDFRRTPFSSLSESFSNAAEADQDSLVASLLGNELAPMLDPLPTYLSSLVGSVELVLGLVTLYCSPWIRYNGILQGESYIGVCVLAE